jgi:hypothetical protein
MLVSNDKDIDAFKPYVTKYVTMTCHYLPEVDFINIFTNKKPIFGECQMENGIQFEWFNFVPSAQVNANDDAYRHIFD